MTDLSAIGQLLEDGATSLQSRLLIAGGQIRIFTFEDLKNYRLVDSLSTLVSPPPWCDKCVSMGGSSGTSPAGGPAKYKRTCPRSGHTCISSHGCVPKEYVSHVYANLPHRLSWETLEMTPRSFREGETLAAEAESAGEHAGRSGAETSARAREAAARRGTQASDSSMGGMGGMGGMDGFLFSSGVPPPIIRMGRKEKGKGHGYIMKRHSIIKEFIFSSNYGKLNVMEELLQSKERIPVVVRGGVPSRWPALLDWRDFSGNFLRKLSRIGKGGRKGFKIQIKVSERKELKDKNRHSAAFFYHGDWSNSQMGMASLVEVREALNVALKYGCGDVLLFHCISSYPTPVTDSNLKNIEYLRSEFGIEVGLSDHTMSNLASTISIGLGAAAIEKHFKPSDDAIGPDSSFSITPNQLSLLVNDCNDAWRAIGKAGFHRSLAEEESRKHRRSIYFMNNLKKGDIIRSADIRAIRPGFGLPPKYVDSIVGKHVNRNVERGDPVSFDVFKEKEDGKKND